MANSNMANYNSNKRVVKTWYNPSKRIKPGLSYEHAQEANEYYSAMAAKRIHKARRALIFAGYKNPSQRMIAKFAKANRTTIAKALKFTWEEVLVRVAQALDVLSSRSRTSTKRSTEDFQKSFEQANSEVVQPVKTSKNPGIAAAQRRCLERASEKEPPPRLLKTVVIPKPIKDGLSLVFRPCEIRAWKSKEGKKEIKAAFASVFKKMHWLNKPKEKPVIHMANAAAYLRPFATIHDST